MQDHQTWHRNAVRWVMETQLFWGSKGQRTRSQITKKHCRRGSLHSLTFVLFYMVKIFGNI